MSIFRYRPYYHYSSNFCSCCQPKQHLINELKNNYMFFAPANSENDVNEGKPTFFFEGNSDFWTALFHLFYDYVYYKKVLNKDEKDNQSEFDSIMSFDIPGFTEFLSYPYNTDFIQKLMEYLSRCGKVYPYEVNVLLIAMHYIVINATYYEYYKKNHFTSLAINCKGNMNREWHQSFPDDIDEFVKKHGKVILNNFKEKQYLKGNKANNPDVKNQYLKVLSFNKGFFKILNSLIFPKMYIISLSRRYDNDDMWANYANEYSGVCIEYKTYPSSKNELMNNDDHKQYSLHKVNYSEEFPKYNFFNSLNVKDSNIDKLFGLRNTNQSRKKHHKICLDSIITKSCDWYGEDEYRLIQMNNNLKDQKLHYDFKNVISVILGIGLHLEDELKIIRILQRKCNESESSCLIYKIYRTKKSTIDRELLMKLKPQKESYDK